MRTLLFSFRLTMTGPTEIGVSWRETGAAIIVLVTLQLTGVAAMQSLNSGTAISAKQSGLDSVGCMAVLWVQVRILALSSTRLSVIV